MPKRKLISSVDGPVDRALDYELTEPGFESKSGCTRGLAWYILCKTPDVVSRRSR